MPEDAFKVLILVGRPASGKSEIIDYLMKLPANTRRERYHIARLDVLDDFPVLWTWFEEDHILSQVLGKPRMHTDEAGYFKHIYQWDLLVECLSLEHEKRLRDDSHYHTHTTTLVDFSRGSEHGGYRRAFNHVHQDLLERAVIVYVNVSYASRCARTGSASIPNDRAVSWSMACWTKSWSGCTVKMTGMSWLVSRQYISS